MPHLSQATSTGFIRRRGYPDASGSVDGPTVISDPCRADQFTAVYPRLQTPSVPDTPDSSASPSNEGYSSASDWLKNKSFRTSGRQRSDSHLPQNRKSLILPYPNPGGEKERPHFETLDAWFEHHFETPSQGATPRQARDNTLRHLEHSSPPNMFHIYFRGQPGIAIQTLLAKLRFDRSDTPLGQLINFRVVNPPVHFKLPDGTFAQGSVRSIKISDSMTIYEFCMKIAGKMGTSLCDQWDVGNLMMVSLELRQESVVCFLGLSTPHEC